MKRKNAGNSACLVGLFIWSFLRPKKRLLFLSLKMEGLTSVLRHHHYCVVFGAFNSQIFRVPLITTTLPSKKLLRCSKQTPTVDTKHNYDPLLFQSNSKQVDLMLFYANNGLFNETRAVWDEIINSCYMPNVQIISELMDIYCRIGRPDEVSRIVHQLILRNYELVPQIYRVALSCLGSRGHLDLMEVLFTDMVSRGFPVDFSTGNDLVLYYSLYGSLSEMEYAYARLKKSRILVHEEGIRAISFGYIKRNKLYSLGEFLREVGLGRRDVGNLIWNLLLLSYSANFKMKSLQREFLRMVDAGFRPDITTFNIRAMAFSKMSLFWDLHLSLEHMNHEQVVPDLVTYGCVVDAYLERRLGKNLEFALSTMNVSNSPRVTTDPIVFEVLGKGEFQASSEAFLEFKSWKDWTYKDLIAIYVKKKYRSNQIFWNY